MVGVLTDKQIGHVLASQIVGRLGTCVDDKIYIVPVSYVYHEGYIYARAKEGMKVEMMRQNPKVCFQVDDIDNMANWRSVIVWGEYEELDDIVQQNEGVAIMSDRFEPYAMSATVAPSPHAKTGEKSLRAVVFRIKVTEKTGRYEKSY
jgi:nitroimidazol reductase NimA-like FMN-containing flavoprotein (pyridoxamine 5'-phosphate oxidase superfamily)